MSLSESNWVRCSRCVITFQERRLYLTHCRHISYFPRFGSDVRDNEVICSACTFRTRVSEIDSKIGQDELPMFIESEKMLDRITKVFVETTKAIDTVRSFRRRQYETTIKRLITKNEELTNLIDRLEKQNDDSRKSIARLRVLLMGRDATIKEKDEVVDGLKCKVGRLNATIRKDGNEYDDIIAEIRQLTRLLSEQKERNKVLSGRVRELQINSLNVGGYYRMLHPKISPNSLEIRRVNSTNVISRERSKFGVSVFCQNKAVRTMGRDMKLPNCTPVKKSCLRSRRTQQFPRTPIPKVRFGGVEEIFLMDDSGYDSSQIFPSIGCGRNSSCR
uniref:RING-type domain-containing protein n=1 Tax=Strongyloides papillosus TaxID=174720 RepID=A0A0N5BHX9_STREA